MALLVSSDCFLMWVVKLELAGVDVGWMGSGIGLNRHIHQCEGVIGHNGWFCGRCYIALLLLFSKQQFLWTIAVLIYLLLTQAVGKLVSSWLEHLFSFSPNPLHSSEPTSIF